MTCLLVNAADDLRVFVAFLLNAADDLRAFVAFLFNAADVLRVFVEIGVMREARIRGTKAWLPTKRF